jgi:mono/diheme cytochrome c family protein
VGRDFASAAFRRSGFGGWIAGACAAVLLCGCTAEKREIGPGQPQTAPASASDPRAPRYEANAYQVSQGGRLFAWYGCQSCHGDDATGVLDLADRRWRYGGGVDQVYASIAQGRPPGMPGYGRAPSEQIWQLTAYVRQLEALPPSKRRRQDADQKGEPTGSGWSGPVR